VAAILGYRIRYNLRGRRNFATHAPSNPRILQHCNLNDSRAPVSNSGLGDSQFYLLLARFFELSATADL